MRKYIFTLLLGSTLMLHAQYTPNTRWPYIYENFTPGKIYFSDNQKGESQLNIHLLGNVLHFVSNDGRILKSDDNNIVRVEIGSDAYLFSDHKLMKIIGEKNNNVLLKMVRGDFDSMTSAKGAYGASLNSSSAKDYTSLNLGGINQPEIGRMLQEKTEGREIPLITEYYFVIDGKHVEANKKAIEKDIEGSYGDAWKKFLKENKIKWKNEDSLITVLDYFTKQ